MTIMDKFLSFYQKLGSEQLNELPNIYSDDIEFVDPVAEHHGIGSVENYFARLLKNCKDCTFIIRFHDTDGSKAYVDWQMTFAHPKLRRGQPIPVDGFSVLELREDKICRQRDYYDMGAMVYEHVPFLGGFISGLRRRMAA